MDHAFLFVQQAEPDGVAEFPEHAQLQLSDQSDRGDQFLPEVADGAYPTLRQQVFYTNFK